jgi:hypothetical protein
MRLTKLLAIALATASGCMAQPTRHTAVDVEICYYMIDDFVNSGSVPLRAFMRVPESMLPSAKFEESVVMCMTDHGGLLRLSGAGHPCEQSDFALRGEVAGVSDPTEPRAEVYVTVDLGEPRISGNQKRDLAFEQHKTKIVRVNIDYADPDKYSYRGFVLESVLDQPPIKYK